MKMSDDKTSFKILIEDIHNFQSSEGAWICETGAQSNSIIVSNFHIQGEIIKTAGFFNEILIVNDGTGNAKVTKGDQVPGDFSWVKEGAYCSVVGNLLDNGKLPHISAIKIAQISNKALREMWPLEVSELKNVLLNKVLVKVPQG